MPSSASQQDVLHGASSQQYTFVTVFFDAELPLLLLQARSITRYLDPSLITEILLVYNSASTLPPATVNHIIDSYGAFGSLVHLVCATDVCLMPIASGWDSQQILKLTAAVIVHTDRYVVFDAKTHLVNPVSATQFQANDGRARANIIDYQTNPLNYALRRACIYFDIDFFSIVTKTLDSVTPFVFYTAHVRDLLADLSRRSSRSFPLEFLHQGFTEFTLYSTWLSSVGIPPALLYDMHQNFPVMIWESDCTSDGFGEKLRQTDDVSRTFLSIHRRSFKFIRPAEAARLAEYWISKALFKTTVDVDVLIRSMAAIKPSARFRLWLKVLKLIYAARRVRWRFEKAVGQSSAGRPFAPICSLQNRGKIGSE